MIIVLLFAALTVLSVFRKDKPLDKSLEIPKCGFVDWSLFVLQIVICIGTTVFIVKLLAR